MAHLGLDLQAGAALAGAEMYGDWYRDPWGWPELTKEAVEAYDVEQDLMLAAGEDHEYHLQAQPHFHLIDVPKTRLSVRPAVVQDPLSRLAYLSAVQSGLARFHEGLPDWVYGWRLRGDAIVASGGPEWRAYVDTLPKPDQEGHGLITDITSFFASVRPERLSQIVYGRLGKTAPASVIMDVVRAHDSLSTRSGLPQRSFASAILAHTVLQPIDDALDARRLGEGITAVRRWMDDLSAEGDEDALYALLLELQERARQVGLELNASKTHLSPVTDTASRLRLEDLKKIEVPFRLVGGEDYSDPKLEPDLEVLKQLEDAIISNPTSVSRTVARAVLISLTENEEFERQREWREIAHYLPHAADSLGRYLRGAGESDGSLWPALGDWFGDYTASVWGRLEWTTAQYALAFPAAHMPAPVVGVLRRWLETSSSILHTAIAVQRICTVSPVLGRNTIRGRVDHTADPLILRIFALGLALAGDEAAAIESVLHRDPRNGLLLKRLASTGWKVPPVARDFDLSAEDSNNHRHG